MASKPTTIVWFRQDLRLADNPALAAAAAAGDVLPVFILETGDGGPYSRPGAASKWWLHHSLRALQKDLGRLILLRGRPVELLPRIAKAVGATGVVWNRCYEPAAIERDREVKSTLKQAGFDAQSFNAALLNEPWEIATDAGKPYKVFTPYWRASQRRALVPPTPAPKLRLSKTALESDDLADWRLTPSSPDWAAGRAKLWQPGEAGATARLDAFIEAGIDGYATLRDRPDLAHVSRLSPHLHWGEISPRQLMARAHIEMGAHPRLRPHLEKFLSEIGWREFAHHLLFHFPQLPEQNLQPAFDAYPWQNSQAQLSAWQRGRTGYPVVDAGMRELWQTGWMHNRLRMVVASFLIKHLRIDWRQGQAWFWNTLLDADLANNAASWQWVAGSGADAAPYFRIFNPVTQGEKFDPEGTYVRRWAPELARMPAAHIHAPFDAPESVCAAAGVVLGRTYPRPIVDHREARQAALDGYAKVSQAAQHRRRDAGTGKTNLP